ncbi:MAG: Fur family transcriptional regulator [Phycisphaerales bacterium]
MEKTKNLFAQHDLRCTRQRARVYRALESCCSHPTAEELHAMVNTGPEACSMSLATVYNTLEALCSAGLCQKIMPPSGSVGASRYDADLAEHLHIVTPDGRLLDVPQQLGDRILSQIPGDALADLEAAMGVKISRISLQLFAEPSEA